VNLRHLAREGSAYMFIGLERGYIFLLCVTWRFVALFLTTTLHVIFPSGLSELKPKVIRKNYPRQIFTFIKVVKRKVR